MTSLKHAVPSSNYKMVPAERPPSCNGCAREHVGYFEPFADAMSCDEVPCSERQSPGGIARIMVMREEAKPLPYIPVSTPAPARKPDPETSHAAAARVNTRSLKQVIMAELSLSPGGLNGTELAYISKRKLNSLTPRFAELRREGLIVDGGKRREGQIVWVLA